MGCEIRRARYLSEISTVRELKEARRELELREWFARERLVEDVYGTFTLDNLLSMIAPQGSLLDRVIGGVGTGFSVVQAVLGTLGSLIAGRRSGTTTRKPAAKAHTTRVATTPAATKSTVTRKRPASPAAGKRTATHTTSRSVSKTASRPVAKKRSPEIEVEVELEETKPTVRAVKR